MSSDGVTSLVVPFLGALQASVAVLLTIFYGVIAAQFNLISESSAKDISKACVRLMLPALLIVNVGSQLHLDTGIRYVPVLIWSITYNVLSILLGMACKRWLKLPEWAVPAIAFNNTTALPLLLVQSLDATGILKSLDTSSDVVDRAKSYFLVNAMVSNSLTFALGPKLMNGQEEDAPNDRSEKEDDEHEEPDANGQAEEGSGEDEEYGSLSERQQATESTSLLPDRIVSPGVRGLDKAEGHGKRLWSKCPPWLQTTLDFLYQFWNAPLIGAVIGAILGLTPPLHRLFFNSQEDGGYLNAWLTASIKNVGSLFASLQVIVVGVKLSQSLLRMKRGERSGNVPWTPMIVITFLRFIFWPLISIPLIWALATKTQVLDKDPILWFAMMLMPAGPPALKLTALADVNGATDDEKMSIAKFLTISYVLSPLICFTVVGALKASEAAVGATT